MDLSNPSDRADSYSDHHVQVVQHRGVWQGGADASSDSTFTIDSPEFEPTERGLSNDELAELVALDSYHHVDWHTGSGNQNAQGTGIIEYSMGANLSGDEHVTNVSLEEQYLSDDERDIDDSGVLDIRANFGNYDSPGVFDAGILAPSMGYVDTAAGAGGSGSMEHTRKFINYRENFGTGPFLDATDDLSIREVWSMENANESVTHETVYLLYWDLDQVEGSRAAFGRP